ncbi:DNA polymerase alpha subunit B-like isoform X1 [Oopsacas minuta]|uniref:DNA polymerase alpha subunit B n=1 Tax=Oopsacas minuta TaxID=111878 RepID=A0AAV7K938_9METZ|nr:DNA polymerase alpha subunit B-like isoform X1 [Oopsacas minuta]
MSNTEVTTEDNVKEQLDSFDIKVSDPVVVSRIQETCNAIGIQADKFVDEWILYTLKVDSGDIKFVLTPDDLDTFLPVLKQSSSVALASSSKPVSIARVGTNRRQGEMVTAPEDLEMIEKYADEETKEKARKEISSMQSLITMDEREEGIPVFKHDPTEDTPYFARKNRGMIIATINEEHLPDQWKDASLTIKWYNSSPPTDRDPCMIELVSSHPAVKPLTAPYKYMDPKQAIDAQVMDEQADEMSELMAIELDIPEFDTLEVSGQDIWVSGRLASDFDNEDEHANSELKSASFAIVGTRETSARHRWAKLDISKLDKYSLFPGQIIAVRGYKNPDEKYFHVREIRTGVPPPIIGRPITTCPLIVYIIAGPYTSSKDLEYEPLNDFIKVINEAKPDLLIMMGPVVSEDNTALGTPELQCSYDELFRRQIEILLDATSKIGTKVVIIPSLKDIYHPPIFPQPPYPNLNLKENILKGANPAKIGTHSHLYPNPAQFDFNTIRFAVSSTDVIAHMVKKEVAVEMTDRFARILGHLFSQRKFYPLYPPSVEVNLEITKGIHLAINQRPHILVIPSQMKEFLRLEGPTLCVNPGRLVRGETGGSFCRLRLAEDGFSGQIIKI